jgi:hypothetical protein
MKAQKMSERRKTVLAAALTRAADEWESELAFVENYGEGVKPGDGPEAKRIREDLSSLQSAREILYTKGLI